MPTSSTDASLLADLRAIAGAGAVIADPAQLLVYENDGYTLERARPRCVVLPATTDEVSRVLARLYRDRIPFVPRGAGTGLSGGALAIGGEVVVGLNRLNRILEIDRPNRRAVVEAGLVNAALNRALAPDWCYAPDPSSQAACTLGGNVAENSGGPHCLKSGVTTNHVHGLTLVTATGEVLRLGGKALDPPGLDLIGLVVGSEGTLGVVTEITVRIQPRPEAVRTVLALFGAVARAGDAVSEIIRRGLVPAALEMMDRLAIQAVEAGSFPVGFPKGQEAVLLIEVDGVEAGLDEEVARIVEVLHAHGVDEVRTARSPEERALWWNNRKTAFGAAGKLAPDYYVQDGVIPRTRLTEVLECVRAIAAEHQLIIANVFHAGDGNLHPLICYDRSQPGVVARVVRAGQEILRACVEAGGSISGEHGVGIEKQCELSLMYTPAELSWQARVRNAIEPEGLANPGKVLPTPARCVELRPLTAEGLESAGPRREID